MLSYLKSSMKKPSLNINNDGLSTTLSTLLTYPDTNLVVKSDFCLGSLLP